MSAGKQAVACEMEWFKLIWLRNGLSNWYVFTVKLLK